MIKVVELPGPKAKPPPELPGPEIVTCDRNRDFSNLWFIQDAAGGNLVGGGGAVFMTFLLINGRSCCAYPATYRGIAGGISAGFDMGIPTGKPTDFTTPFNVAPKDFNGDARIFSASLSIFEHATLDFARSTDPEEIDIGGVNLTDPFSFGVFGRRGRSPSATGSCSPTAPPTPAASRARRRACCDRLLLLLGPAPAQLEVHRVTGVGVRQLVEAVLGHRLDEGDVEGAGLALPPGPLRE